MIGRARAVLAAWSARRAVRRRNRPGLPESALPVIGCLAVLVAMVPVGGLIVAVLLAWLDS